MKDGSTGRVLQASDHRVPANHRPDRTRFHAWTRLSAQSAET
jgi:hypothetical protein